MTERAHSTGRYGYLVLAYGCVGLGMLGVVVPLLPTTPFLLVAAWAATRSSPRLRWWLYRHPRYGPSIRAWQRHQSIPVPVKATGCALLALSWITLWLLGFSGPALAGFAVFFLLIATLILTRPSVSPTTRSSVSECRLDQ